MSFKYPTFAEIGTNVTLYPPTGSRQAFAAQAPRHATVCSNVEMSAVMYEVRKWSVNSQTARRIIHDVNLSTVVVHVIGMKGCGFSCFCSDHPIEGQGTAYVDVQSQYEVNGNPLHTYIVILHELGHAKQFLENPIWFNRVSSRTPNIGLTDIRDAAVRMQMGRAPASVAPVPVVQLPTGHGGGPPPPPALGPMGGQRAIQRDAEDALGNPTRATPTFNWPFVIEQDNMARHEWPICRETGNPVRPGYRHISYR